MIDILIIIAYTNITSDVIITNDIVNAYLFVHPVYDSSIFRKNIIRIDKLIH